MPDENKGDDLLPEQVSSGAQSPGRESGTFMPDSKLKEMITRFSRGVPAEVKAAEGVKRQFPGMMSFIESGILVAGVEEDLAIQVSGQIREEVKTAFLSGDPSVVYSIAELYKLFLGRQGAELGQANRKIDGLEKDIHRLDAMQASGRRHKVAARAVRNLYSEELGQKRQELGRLNALVSTYPTREQVEQGRADCEAIKIGLKQHFEPRVQIIDASSSPQSWDLILATGKPKGLAQFAAAFAGEPSDKLDPTS